MTTTQRGAIDAMHEELAINKAYIDKLKTSLRASDDVKPSEWVSVERLYRRGVRRPTLRAMKNKGAITFRETDGFGPDVKINDHARETA